MKQTGEVGFTLVTTACRFLAAASPWTVSSVSLFLAAVCDWVRWSWSARDLQLSSFMAAVSSSSIELFPALLEVIFCLSLRTAS